MPLLEPARPGGRTGRLSRTCRPPPASSAAARKFGVKPMPALDWNEDVARETAHLYERIKTVVPAVEWPVFAPYVKAINDAQERAQRRHPGA